MARTKGAVNKVLPSMDSLKIEYRSVESLKPYKNNARTHSETQVDEIAASVIEFGWTNPMLIKSDGMIIAGHGRYQAATTRLDMKEVPVIVVDHLSDALVRKLILADNKIALNAGWDDTMLAKEIHELDLMGEDLRITGFDEIELDDILAQFNVDDENDQDVEQPQPEPPVIPVSTFGDVWKIGRHVVMCGSSLNNASVEQLIKDKVLGGIFTDPPYGIGIDGNAAKPAKDSKQKRKAHEKKDWDDERPPESLFEYILSFNKPTVIFGGNYFADLLPAQRGWIYWDKGQNGMDQSDGELAWSNLDKPMRAVVCNRANIGKSIHPTQKPVAVVKFCLELMAFKKNEIVLDLFGGSGSTLAAAEELKIACHAMELDPGYVDGIVLRMQELTGEKAIHGIFNKTFADIMDERLNGE